MELTKTHKIIISILTVVVLFAIYVTLDKKWRNKVQESPTDNGVEITDAIIASTTNGGAVHVNTPTGGYTIEQVPVGGSKTVPQPIPDLTRPVMAVGGAKVTTEAIVLATEHIVSLQARLKKDPSDFPAWLDLGMYQKMAGDYQGTVISWTYASRLAPTDYISQGNLGNLYAYFIKDNVKAEMYYKKAIANNGLQAYLYVQLAEVYRDIIKDSAKALAIVNQGLLKIPNNASLLEIKATFK